MALEVAVLVSVGRHPASGRGRRADADARALELALGIAGAKVRAIHAGDAGAPALRDYLGMGLDRLTVLDLPPEADPVPALVQHLASAPPDLVLAGPHAEGGEDSGLVPYLLAEALGMALAPGIVELGIEDGRARMLQALPRGRRRILAAPLPLLATVPVAAPPARLSAFGPARRGRIDPVTAPATSDQMRAGWEERPARRRPKRLKVMSKGSAADRVKAVTEMQGGKGRHMTDASPEEAAEAIYDYLVAEGILQKES